jgi:D-glycero-alpha-D-manno-heptose 1-phosphate guanylyltransferase
MKDLSDLTAVVLAGGLGIRLRPVIADGPKVLASVNGRPFLAYLLDQLAAIQISRVVLCTGYLGEQVRGEFGDHYGSLNLSYSQEPYPLGTAGALRLAMPLLGSDPILVMNGDSYCEVNLRALWSCHVAKCAQATLLLLHQDRTQRFGRVQIDTDGFVEAFREKDESSEPGWINGGIYLLHPHLLKAIPEGREVSLEKNIFPSWIGRGLYGFCGEGRFLDIGIPESYAAGTKFFAQGKGETQRTF